MPAHLIIEDGQPSWWDSADIWVVPGNDPNGPPGAPIAGTSNYLWGRVHNTGNSASNGVRVDFYWADPSGQIAVGAATQIGSAFADLPPGATQEVLCLVPWVPVIVNGGHECLLAVAHGPGDINPLPDPLPNGFPFLPKQHEQIAQRNVTVVLAARRAQLLSIAVAALPRATKKVELHIEQGGELPERLLATLGLERWQPAKEARLVAGLERTPHCNGDAPGEQKLALEVPRGQAQAVYLSVRAEALPPRQYALLRVLESQEGKVMGGITYIVTDLEKEQTQEQEQEQHSPEEQAS
ncbi:hypothetical protein CSQ93_11075 [Janthinobacterium sp. BJB426]|uniref:hypothetical protein n=1 Tax=Janthinobacterium sp. BJB426 TaxID=2048010 RepID=UPI000C10D875|nr:hypothetical protein [Janthinobacterium sp. BJB426]PHV28102.1 hypothetical protein CSQ93_11075 [Janthinobacterium sp. BJB426]